MEGKESQKDILRLRQLEQAKHENNSTFAATSSRLNEEMASSSMSESESASIANGHPINATE